MKEKNNFYFQGKFFEHEEEFWKYVQKWSDIPLDQETAERLLDHIKRDILLNVFMRGARYTNKEFQEYLGKLFEYAIKEMRATR